MRDREREERGNGKENIQRDCTRERELERERM